MKISFCSTCAQRLHQLKKIWNDNIKTISDYSNSEWVLLNYDGDAAMHKFVMSKYKSWPKNFVYAKELSGHEWHMSVAKNIAHQLGSGNILFNLDCDNFIGSAIKPTIHSFENGAKVAHLFSGVGRDGTAGRIAIDRELFYSMGGYDESFYPMAGQDTDILARAKALGHKISDITDTFPVAIKNTKIESVKLCSRYNLAWEDFSRENKKKIIQNISNKILIANLEKGMTKPNVEIFRK